MYETNKATLSDDYIYEHIELDDDLKPYLNLLSPPPNKIFCKTKIQNKFHYTNFYYSMKIKYNCIF